MYLKFLEDQFYIEPPSKIEIAINKLDIDYLITFLSVSTRKSYQ